MVGQTLFLSQTPDCPLVTGQLTVGFRAEGGGPYQGIKPVNAQADASQNSPQQVSLQIMGVFMRQNMPLPDRRLHTFRRQVDGGP